MRCFLYYHAKEGGEVQNYELAENDYMSGMKYKEIAEKYGVSINTVKSWKKRYEWDRKGVHTKTQKGCTQKRNRKAEIKEPVAPEVETVLENAELTEKQRLFCLYFVKCFNATKAYRKAYCCNEYTAAACGSRLLRNANIQKEIEELKHDKLNQIYLTTTDIFQKYMDIAFSDIGEYLSFGKKQVPQWLQNKEGEYIPVIDPNTGQQKVIEYSYVDLNASENVDTSIISEISEGKNGIKVKLADKMRALEWLGEHMDIATEEQKARIKLLKMQTEIIHAKDSNDDASQKKIDNISNILKQMSRAEERDIDE